MNLNSHKESYNLTQEQFQSAEQSVVENEIIGS